MRRLLLNLYHFIVDDPREANTEGGIFPAIFGTFIMTLLMSALVTPVGVIGATYLREYAKQGTLVQAVRICVNNLAGVPSIVFGVFGLGFFVYYLGGTIDELFYWKKLAVDNTPTFGTSGILWASLTLALMTLPVVIVSTEEALSAVPARPAGGSSGLRSLQMADDQAHHSSQRPAGRHDRADPGDGPRRGGSGPPDGHGRGQAGPVPAH